MHSFRPAPDVTAIADAAPIPGLGVLPVNAFVLHAAHQLLIAEVAIFVAIKRIEPAHVALLILPRICDGAFLHAFAIQQS